MAPSNPYGYAGKLLRVDLTSERITQEVLDRAILKKFLGGVGIGGYYLYEEVPPGVEWYEPGNRIIIATGPLTGTKMRGSGGFLVVTKGSLTNGAAAAQANGFLGAYLKFCGFDGIILQGKASRLSYLYVHDGAAEIRDASYLAGKDTWETERLIKEELGKGEREMSLFSIGVAGENLVRFACLVGDKGHVAAHNGVGAVLGAKNLKAIAVAKGKDRVVLSDRKGGSVLAKSSFERVTQLDTALRYKWGTLGARSKARTRVELGYLPVKNYTTNIFPDAEIISAETLRSQRQFKVIWKPCWACRFRHCHLIDITSGPFAGYSGEEPDYETLAGFTSLIGNTDLAGGVVLANEVDRLGMDANESSWLIAWLMECNDKGFIDKKTTDGLEMNWGDVKAARAMLYKIAHREGFGDVLAEGLMRAAEHVGEQAQELAVYTKKGNTPRMHDHRSSWPMLLDTVTSEWGRDMDGALIFSAEKAVLPPQAGLFTSGGAAAALAKVRGNLSFHDSLVVCKFNLQGLSREDLAELVSAATGWDFTADQVAQIGLRIVNLFRAFNIRHGHTRDLDMPSPRYSSAPVDGPNQGKSITPVWDEALANYYRLMGWDIETGKPLPDTLRSLGLEYTIPDIWT